MWAAFHWPTNIETLAATPGPPSGDEKNPVLAMLGEADQRLVISAYNHAAAQSMAAYEAAPEMSHSSSKFDYALANPTANGLLSSRSTLWVSLNVSAVTGSAA